MTQLAELRLEMPDEGSWSSDYAAKHADDDSWTTLVNSVFESHTCAVDCLYRMVPYP